MLPYPVSKSLHHAIKNNPHRAIPGGFPGVARTILSRPLRQEITHLGTGDRKASGEREKEAELKERTVLVSCSVPARSVLE